MSDKSLQEAVMKELEWDPKVDPAHIGVSVKDGAVTLSGHVSSFAEKMAALRAAERVYGVKAVADELEIRLPGSSVRDDTDIAEHIAKALRWNTLVPDSVNAEVRDGHVTLRGEVEWMYQREAAEREVRDVTGVKSVINIISIKPRFKVMPSEIEQRVEEAIKRNADLDASSIWATTSNGVVHLHGHVHSVWEKKIAEEAAASAPGVEEVDNEIMVAP
jgi:osmotically-inducible protein OsmY